MNEFGIVAIVQCRAGSSRLKGKALKPIAGRPMLAHVLERAAAIREDIPVILATSVNKRDDQVAKLGKKCGAEVYRGDEQDVLGRMSEAAKMMSARIVIRLTGDCPLLAPDVARMVLEEFIKSGPVIATNDTANTGWPDGLDVEVFRAWDLQEAAELATSRADREHVTPWLRQRLTHVVLPGPPGAPKIKLSVDTQTELDHVKSVFLNLKKDELGYEATFAAARKVLAETRAKRVVTPKKAAAAVGAR